MTAKKAVKRTSGKAVTRTSGKARARKPAKGVPKGFGAQALVDIGTVIQSQRKLDLELKKIQKKLRTLLGHQYIFR